MLASKLITITNENYLNYSDSDTTSERAEFIVRKKAAMSLIFIWVALAIICFLLFYLNGSTNNNDLSAVYTAKENPGSEGLFNKNGRHQKTITNPNDAFVFVKINRQYIITPFSSNQQPETDITTANYRQKDRPLGDVVAVTKVIKKITPSVKKDNSGFEIKPTPK